jgi:hypothetical protein
MGMVGSRWNGVKWKIKWPQAGADASADEKSSLKKSKLYRARMHAPRNKMDSTEQKSCPRIAKKGENKNFSPQYILFTLGPGKICREFTSCRPVITWECPRTRMATSVALFFFEIYLRLIDCFQNDGNFFSQRRKKKNLVNSRWRSVSLMHACYVASHLIGLFSYTCSEHSYLSKNNILHSTLA